MINNVVLVGRMTRDAELRYTGSGTAVASFSIAVERTFTNAQGERETDFINCVAWSKTAEIISQFHAERFSSRCNWTNQTRNYTNNEGRKVYITEVVCENFEMLEPKSVTEKRGQNDNESSRSGYSNNSNYSNQNNSNNTQRNNQAPGAIKMQIIMRISMKIHLKKMMIQSIFQMTIYRFDS